MRPALILIAPALAMGLSACEPLPETAELTPSVAPVAPTGFARAPRGAGTPRRSTAGTFAPTPITATPIIESTVEENPSGIVPPPPPGASLDPSIGAAIEDAPVAPFPDPPVGTVPGGPLPDLQFTDPTAAVAPGAGASTPMAVPAAAETAPVAGVAPAAPAGPGISDEQSFEAVTARESIESDAARLERLRAERQEVAPQPVPERPEGGAPNIVSYAVAAGNAVGEAVHPRSALASNRAQRRACARFASPDRAQEAFLAAGGPRRDRHGLDPDGDGFACDWDPAPFRAAAY